MYYVESCQISDDSHSIRRGHYGLTCDTQMSVGRSSIEDMPKGMIANGRCRSHILNYFFNLSHFSQLHWLVILEVMLFRDPNPGKSKIPIKKNAYYSRSSIFLVVRIQPSSHSLLHQLFR